MKKYLPKSLNNPQGFTLIELLIAVSILAVLGVIGFSVFTNAQRNTRDSRRKADVDAISKALENDFITNNRTQYQAVTTTMFGGGAVPSDPGTYTYTYPSSAAATYVVCAQLEAASGGNSSNATGTAAANGAYFCRKNQQ